MLSSDKELHDLWEIFATIPAIPLEPLVSTKRLILLRDA